MAKPYRPKGKRDGGKYIIPYKDIKGRWRNITGTASYSETVEMQLNLIRKIQKERDDPLKKPIGRDLENYLRERRGGSGRQVSYARLETDLMGWTRSGGEGGEPVRTWEDALPDRLNAWLDRAQAGKLPGQRRAWGATTANMARMRVRGFCSWAVARGIVDRNPTDGSRGRRGELRKVRRALSKAECEALLRECPDPDERDLFACLLMTGLRVGEAVSLRWDDIELGDAPAIRVRAETAKTREARTVPLPERLRAILEARRDRLPDVEEPRVFGFWIRRYRHSDGACRRLLRVLRRIGEKLAWPRLKEVDVHSTRVTFLTLADAAGYSRNTIRALAGHRGFSMLEKYLKDAPAAIVEQVNRIGCVL